MSHSFSLSLAAADILLEQGKLGSAPVPFALSHVGTTVDQRAQIRDAVFADLASRGMMPGGRLDADVELALATFVNGTVAISAAARLDDGKPLFARVASNGRFAVSVRQDGNLLAFEEIRPTGMVSAIVDLLPLTPAAPGQSVTIARPAPKPPRRPAADEGYDPFTDVSGPRSHPSPQLRSIERIFEKPRLRLGQFTAFVAGGHGRETALRPVGWFDTELGRYLMTTHEASDGQLWITYAPADNARLAQTLYQQLEGEI